MRERETSHLRLVVAREENDRCSKELAPQHGEQLAFPYPETSTVIFVYLTDLRDNEFANIISDLTPRWIIDVRTVPRLDTIATSRRKAFSLFESVKASYVDLFGRLGIKSYHAAESNPAFWGSAVFDLFMQSKTKGPYLFMFDNMKLMASSGQVLPNIIKPAIGKKAQFSSIGTAEPSHNIFFK